MPNKFKKEQNLTPNSIDAHVGDRVRNLRILQNMTQSDLAKHLGLSFQQLQKYETGDNRISASKLYIIARTLDVQTGYFFEGLDTSDDTEVFELDVETARIANMISNIPDPDLKARLQEIIKLMIPGKPNNLSCGSELG